MPKQDENAEVVGLPVDHILSLKDIEQGYWWYEGRLKWASRLLQKNINTKDKIKYIDLGCGTGGFASALHRKFHFSDVALLDGDPKMLAEISNHLDLETHQVNFTQDFRLPWKPQLITCMDVLEHLEDDAGFLEKVADHLSPNGVLILSVPALPSLTSEWDHKLGHYRRYQKWPLRRLLEKQGFDVNQISFMWSFMAPVGLVRKFTATKDGQTGFPKIPGILNQLLKTSSDVEWFLSRLVPIPMGTSLILCATKK